MEDEWQVEWSPALLHPDLTEGDLLVLHRQAAPRAEVLAGDGSPLVTERPVYRIGIDKTVVEAADEDAADVVAGVEDIAGARALPGTMQLAPTPTFARPLLGTVGEATAEIVEESDGRIQQGDIVGLSGLQRAYDEVLAGMPGIRVDIEPAEGEPATVHEQAAVAGEPIATTLDVGLQIEAEQVLVNVGPPSAVVAVQPSTGDVLAAASGPGSEGYSPATLGQYAPGSTFKIVSLLALLRTGHSPEEAVDCPDTVIADGRRFGNYSDYPASELGEITP